MAFVNFAQGVEDGADATIASVAANHTSGNHLIVAVLWDQAGTAVSGIVDTAGNSYQQGVAYNVGTTRIAFWYAPAAITGNATNVVTATINSASAQFKRIGVWQFSDFASQTIAFDTSGTGTGTSTAASTSAATTNAAAEIIVAATFWANLEDSGSGLAAGTNIKQRRRTTAVDAVYEDRIVASIASYNAAMTGSTPPGAILWVMLHATFMQSGAPAAPAPNVNDTSTITEAQVMNLKNMPSVFN
jgi:hypothetical protein